MMIAQLSHIVKELNGELNHSESTWFNGHARMPLHNFNIVVPNSGATINYEFRQNEFSKPKASAFTQDVHLIEITLKSSSGVEFEISTKGGISKLLNKSAANFIVSCKNTRIKEAFHSNGRLIEFFTLAKTKPEFSPLLTAKNGVLTITYSTQQFEGDLLLNAIELVDCVNTIV